MSKNKQTLEERHFNEVLTDNAALNQYSQCRTCFFRDKTTVGGVECGWKKGICAMFEYPGFKPDDVMRNRAECDYYEPDKD